MTRFVPGATNQLTATGNYSDGSTANLTASVVWASSNPATGTVNSSGVFQAIAVTTPPNTTVTATYGALTGSIVMTIESYPAPPLVGITVTVLSGSNVLRVGATDTVVATCNYQDGSSLVCSQVPDARGDLAVLSSTVMGVATVTNPQGVLTALSRGQTDIIATVGSISSYPFIEAIVTTSPVGYQGTHWPR
jgi:hypothetical protein